MSSDSDYPPHDDPLMEDGGNGRERGGFVPEFLRKVAVAGLGAVFMTEEGVRNLAGQMKLPKEVLGYLLAQAEKTKDDVSRVISEELRGFLQSDKLRQEFLKLVSGMSVEVTAQFRLVPPASGTAPSTTSEPSAPGAATEPPPKSAGGAKAHPSAAAEELPLPVPRMTVTRISARHKKPKKD